MQFAIRNFSFPGQHGLEAAGVFGLTIGAEARAEHGFFPQPAAEPVNQHRQVPFSPTIDAGVEKFVLLRTERPAGGHFDVHRQNFPGEGDSF